jgi:hypothetical protein
VNTTWSHPDPDVRAFLDDFDERGADPDGGSEQLFAPTFLAADPSFAVPLTAAQLAGTLPTRRAMFEAAGVGAVRRQSAQQLRLDDRHVLVSGTWSADRAGGALELSSTLLLRSEPDGYRVLVYLNHHDISALLASPLPGSGPTP